jgi:hypothetical protein
VMDRIVALKDRVGVDEMAVVTWTHDEEVRRASYTHLARAMGFAPKTSAPPSSSPRTPAHRC